MKPRLTRRGWFTRQQRERIEDASFFELLHRENLAAIVGSRLWLVSYHCRRCFNRPLAPSPIA